jgi:hypothetical protein
MLVGSNHFNTEKNGGKPVNHNLVNFCDLSSDASAWQSSLNYPPPRECTVKHDKVSGQVSKALLVYTNPVYIQILSRDGSASTDKTQGHYGNHFPTSIIACAIATSASFPLRASITGARPRISDSRSQRMTGVRRVSHHRA